MRARLPRLPVVQRQRDRSGIVRRYLSVRIARFKNVLGAGPSNNFLCQMADDLFGTPIPKADSTIAIDQVNAHWQFFEHGADESRIVKETG